MLAFLIESLQSRSSLQRLLWILVLLFIFCISFSIAVSQILLTAAAVVLPKAMAYATIAGLPVQVGPYTAFLPMVIYAVLGTSRVLSVSTTTTIAILAAAQLGKVVPGGDPASLLTASAMLTLLVGLVLTGSLGVLAHVPSPTAQ